MNIQGKDNDSSILLRCVSCGRGDADGSLVHFWDGCVYCQECLRQHFPPAVTAWYDAHKELRETRRVIGNLRGVTFTAVVLSVGALAGGMSLILSNTPNTPLRNTVGFSICFIGVLLCELVCALKLEKTIMTRHYDKGALYGWVSSLGLVLIGGMLGIMLGGSRLFASASAAGAAVFVGSIVILQGLRLVCRLLGGAEVSVEAGTLSARFALGRTRVPIRDCSWWVGNFRDEYAGVVNPWKRAVVIQCGSGWSQRTWRMAVGATDESYKVWAEFLEVAVDRLRNDLQ